MRYDKEFGAWAREHPTDVSAIGINALLDEIDRLTAELEKHRWIPVSERLPEVKGRYLFQAKSTVSNKYFVSIEYYEPGWGTHPLFTHWKPLPEPPKEEEC